MPQRAQKPRFTWFDDWKRAGSPRVRRIAAASERIGATVCCLVTTGIASRGRPSLSSAPSPGAGTLAGSGTSMLAIG